MLDCLARLLFSAALEVLKQWLRDWGVLLITAVIAAATLVQGLFAVRLYKLQRTIEKSRLEPLFFVALKAMAWETALPGSTHSSPIYRHTVYGSNQSRS